MFVAITVANSLESICVPIKWVNQVYLTESANNGVNCAQPHVFFFSPNIAKSADFNQSIAAHFNPTRDGCYYGHINKYFGEFIFSPVNYSL